MTINLAEMLLFPARQNLFVAAQGKGQNRCQIKTTNGEHHQKDHFRAPLFSHDQ